MPNDKWNDSHEPNMYNPSYRKYIDRGINSRIDDTMDKIQSEEVFNYLRQDISGEQGQYNGARVSRMNSDILDESPIADRYDKGYFTKFKRLPILDPFNHYDGAYEYLFFTKPDLCICQSSTSILTSNLVGNPIFEYALQCYPEVLAGLQSSANFPGISKKYPGFIPFLTNAASSSLDLPDSDSTDIESPQNIYGTKIYYRGTSAGSDKDYEFNIEFEDTKQSEIYTFFKLWDEYKKLDWAGLIDISADDCAHWENYIAYKILFDQITLFKIIVAADGYTILFWAEIVGCYPKGVPRSVWNNPNDLTNYMKITTNWRGHFVVDSDPLSLAHFNQLSVGSTAVTGVGRDFPLYGEKDFPEQIVLHTNKKWPARPYIYLPSSIRTDKGKKHPYQLRWLEY